MVAAQLSPAVAARRQRLLAQGFDLALLPGEQCWRIEGHGILVLAPHDLDIDRTFALRRARRVLVAEAG